MSNEVRQSVNESADKSAVLWLHHGCYMSDFVLISAHMALTESTKEILKEAQGESSLG